MFFTSAFRNLILGLNNTSVYIKDMQRDLLQQIKVNFQLKNNLDYFWHTS